MEDLQAEASRERRRGWVTMRMADPILRRYCASSLCDLRLRCYFATQEISNCTGDLLVVGF